MDIEKDTTAQQINSQNGQNQTISITKNAKNINDNNININNNKSSNDNENVEGTQVNQKNSLINQDYTVQKLDFERIDYSAQENIQVNITDYFKIGTFLDAKDNNFTWCAGIVNAIDMQRNRLTILFDGWNSQMMEEYSMKSFKLQPYRLYTYDYTGGKTLGTRPDLKYSQQLVEQHIKLMDNMIQKKFYGYNAFQITQSIRGQIFRISDYLLTLDLDQLSKAKENLMESEDTQNKDKIELEHDNSSDKQESKNLVLEKQINLIIKAIKKYIDFSIAYFKILPNLYSAYQRGQQQYDLYQQNAGVALSQCLQNICSNLLYYIGKSNHGEKNHQRTKKLFNEIYPYAYENQHLFSNQTNFARLENFERINRTGFQYQQLQILFLNYFYEQGGFDVLISLLYTQTQTSIPIKMVEIIYSIFQYTCDYMKKEQSLKYSKILLDFLQQKVEISGKEIKDFDKDSLNNIFQNMEKLFLKYLESTQQSSQIWYEIKETLDLNIIFKFLTSGIMDKKLRGLNEIKDICKALSTCYLDNSNGRQDQYNYQFNFINQDSLINWLSKKEVLEFIIKESNAELIKRSHDIFQFYLEKKELGDKLINLIWSHLTDKHESIVRAINDLIINIVPCLNLSEIDKFYKLIKQIPLENYTELSLELLKGFMIKASKQRFNINKNEKIQDNLQTLKGFYGFDEMWGLVFETNIENEIVRKKSFEYFLNFMSFYLLKLVPISLLTHLFNQIKNNQKINLVCQLINRYLDNQFSIHFDIANQSKQKQIKQQQILNDRLKLQAIFKQIQENDDVINLIIQEIIKLNSQNDINMQQDIQGLFLLLENLMKKSKSVQFVNFSLNYEQLEQLWDAFTQGDKDQFSMLRQWLTNKYKYKNKLCNFKVNNNFGREEVKLIFNKLLSNPEKLDFQNITPEQFDCFVCFWLECNTLLITQNIKTGKLKLKNSNYSGKDTLWQIFLQAKNKQVYKQASQILSQINTRFDENQNNDIDKKEILISFTNQCMDLLQQGIEMNNSLYIIKGTILLNGIFESYEGKFKYKSSELNQTFGRQFKISLFIDANQSTDIHVNPTHPFGIIREKVSKQFNIPMKILQLRSKNNIYDSDNDDENIMDLGYPSRFKIKQKDNAGDYEEMHPKHIISSNQKWFDILLDILNIDENNSDEFNGSFQEVNAIIWEILTKLPTNKTLQDQILKAEQPWEEILHGSFHKTLYCYKIIESFTNKNKIQIENNEELEIELINERQIWIQKFIKTKGPQYIVDNFMNFRKINDPLSKIYINKLLGLMLFYLNQRDEENNNKLLQQYLNSEQQVQQFGKQIIQLMNQLINYCIERKKKDLENCQQEIENYFDTLKTNSQHQNDIRQPKFWEIETDVFKQLSYLFNYLQSMFKDQQSSICSIIEKYQFLGDFLYKSLVDNDNQTLKKQAFDFIYGLVANKSCQILIKVLMGDVLDKVMKNEQAQSQFYFELVSKIIREVSIEDLQQTGISFVILVKVIQNFLSSKEIREIQEQNILLNGILQVLTAITFKFPETKLIVGQQQQFVKQLLENYLFAYPSPKDPHGPKCKFLQTRNQAFILLKNLCQNCNENMDLTISFLKNLHLQSGWRTKAYNDWYIQRKDSEKSSSGFVGIKNLGCVCYMISLLQQMFMIPGFRQSILTCEDPAFDELQEEDNLLYQLKCLFISLSESEKQAVNPKGMCQAYKDFDNQPVNVFQQMDAEEFYNGFLDKLENQIKKSPQNENFLLKYFGGKLSNEIIGKDCPHRSEREENFVSLQVQVENKKDIYESLKEFVSGEILEGDNAYQCQACDDKKVTALKRTSLKSLPHNLVVMAKRFRYDYTTFQRIKINDHWEFPMELDLEPYTLQGLYRKEGKKYEGKQYPQNYFKYKLKGMVIHSGTADNGHYYSYIQKRGKEENEWYEFNDNIVKPFDPTDIPNEAFGGEEKWRYYGNTSENKEKCRNAYILFYDRIETYEEEENNQDSDGKDKNKMDEEVQNPQNKNKLDENQIQQQIDKYCKNFRTELRDKNKKHHSHMFVFNEDYFDFVQKLILEHNFSKNTDWLQNEYFTYDKKDQKYYDLELLKLGISFFLICQVREKYKANVFPFMNHLKFLLSQNFPACQWLFRIFQNQEYFQELILENQCQLTRRAIIGLLEIPMKVVYNQEKNVLKIPVNLTYITEVQDKKIQLPKSEIGNFINLCINSIYILGKSDIFQQEFYLIFIKLMSLGDDIYQLLLEKKIVGRTIDFMLRDILKQNWDQTGEYQEIEEFLINFADIQISPQSVQLLGQTNKKKQKTFSNFKKKNRYNLYGNSYTYIWQTLYQILNTQKNLVGEENQFALYDQENELIPLFWEKIILNCLENKSNQQELQDKASYRNFAKIVTLLCFKNVKYTNEILQIILKNLKNKTAENTKSDILVLKYLMQIQDEMQDQRIEQSFKTLISGISDNLNYIQETIILLQFMIIIARNNIKVQEWMKQNQYQFVEIEQFLQKEMKKQLSPLKFIKENEMSNYKASLNFNGVKWPKNVKSYFNSLKTVFVSLERIFNGQQLEPDQLDLDEDLASLQINIHENKLLDYFVHTCKGFVTAKVIAVYGDMIKIQYQVLEQKYPEDREAIVSIDDEKLFEHKQMQEVIIYQLNPKNIDSEQNQQQNNNWEEGLESFDDDDDYNDNNNNQI